MTGTDRLLIERAGSLCYIRAFCARFTTSSRDQHGGPHCHPLLCRSQHCVLHPPSMECGVHNGQCRGGKYFFSLV
jgi:hypothetical protein